MKNTKKTRGFCPVNIQGVLLCMVMVLMVAAMLPAQASAARNKKLSKTGYTFDPFPDKGKKIGFLNGFSNDPDNTRLILIGGEKAKEAKKVKWTSSNPKVVAIRKTETCHNSYCYMRRYNKQVKYISIAHFIKRKAGKATITAKVGKKKIKCKIVIGDPEFTSYSGKTEKLNTSGVSNIKWASSDTNIATVKNGNVQLKKTGKVTITGKTKKQKVKYKFTVKDPYLCYADNSKVESGRTFSTEQKGEIMDFSLVGATITNCQSSDPKIAKITWRLNSFNVETVSCGTATITVSGSNKKVYSFKVELMHNEFGDWIIDKAATCTEEGSRHKVCPICDFVWSETIKPAGHKYNESMIKVVSGPSCISGSEYHYICSVCGAEDSYSHYKRDDALGHQESDWIVDQEATCTHSGKSHKECTRCGMTLDINYDFPEAKGHVESDWIVDKEPTCLNAGEQHIECTVCHQVIRRERIEATGHTESDWIIEKEPTPGENGVRYKECTKCKKVLKYEEILAE